MKPAKFCRIALILAIAVLTPCTIAAQDFSTVPDFPEDFTLVDPSAPSGTGTTTTAPSATTRRDTTTPTTTSVTDTATGPESYTVITLAALLGFVGIAGAAVYKLGRQ